MDVPLHCSRIFLSRRPSLALLDFFKQGVPLALKLFDLAILLNQLLLSRLSLCLELLLRVKELSIDEFHLICLVSTQFLNLVTQLLSVLVENLLFDPEGRGALFFDLKDFAFEVFNLSQVLLFLRLDCLSIS